MNDFEHKADATPAPAETGTEESAVGVSGADESGLAEQPAGDDSGHGDEAQAVEATPETDGGSGGEAAEAAPPAEDAAEESSEGAEAEAASEESEVVEEVAGEEAAGEQADGEEAAPAEPEPGVPGMDWYIIHTYSGFENKVRESLRTRAEAFGYGERVGEVLIPTEDVMELRAGKRVTTKRLLYPGYVLVQLDLDDELWHVVKNTPRVTGFVGGGQKPNPLSADEVNQILYRQSAAAERPRPKMTFERSDSVKIVDGPFANFTGTVEEVNEDRSTLKVMVTIFGRGTPVELEYFQVEKEG